MGLARITDLPTVVTVPLTGAEIFELVQGGTSYQGTMSQIATSLLTGLADGTAAVPSLAFLADTDTGIYRVGTNSLGVSASGSNRLTISALGATFVDPLTSFSFIPSGSTIPTNGLYLPSANTLGLAVASTIKITVSFSGVTFADLVTAASFIPSGSTVPTNGLYLPAANTVGVASNATLRGSVNSTGNWVLAAPSSGVTLALTSTSGQYFLTDTDGTCSFNAYNNGAGGTHLGTTTNHPFAIFTNGFANERVVVAAAGNVTIAAPSSGATLVSNTAASGIAASLVSSSGSVEMTLQSGAAGSTFSLIQDGSDIAYVYNRANAALILGTNNADRVTIASAGNVTIAAPSSGTPLKINALAGTNARALQLDVASATSECLIAFALNGSDKAFIGSIGTATNLTAGSVQNDLVIRNSQNILFTADGGTTANLKIATAGNVTIAAPSSGTTLTVSGGVGVTAITAGLVNIGDTTSLGAGANMSSGANNMNIGTTGANSMTFYTAAASRVSITSGGNVSILAPSAGAALAITGVAAGTSQTWTDGTVSGQINFPASQLAIGTSSAHSVVIQTSGTGRVTVNSAGNVTIAAPSSGDALTVNAFSTTGKGLVVGNTIEVNGTASNAAITAAYGATIALAANMAGSISRLFIGDGSGWSFRISSRIGSVTTDKFTLNDLTNAATFAGSVTATAFTGDGSALTGVTASGVAASALTGTTMAANVVTSSLTSFGASIALGTPASGTLTNCTIPASAITGTTLAAVVTASSLTSFGASIALGTPASGTLTNCTFPTLNQNTTGSAAKFTTARTINGTSFDGTANITVTADASTLTGSSLAAGVTGSSLTSIGATCTVNSFTVGYRAVPRSTTATTAAVGDVGKCIAITANINIPTSTFAAGDVFSIYNDSAGALSITAGGTQRLAGTATTGTLTIALRGIATVWFNSATEWVVSGNVS